MRARRAHHGGLPGRSDPDLLLVPLSATPGAPRARGGADGGTAGAYRRGSSCAGACTHGAGPSQVAPKYACQVLPSRGVRTFCKAGKRRLLRLVRRRRRGAHPELRAPLRPGAGTVLVKHGYNRCADCPLLRDAADRPAQGHRFPCSRGLVRAASTLAQSASTEAVRLRSCEAATTPKKEIKRHEK